MTFERELDEFFKNLRESHLVHLQQQENKSYGDIPFYNVNFREILLFVNKKIIEISVVYENEDWELFRQSYLRKYIRE